MIIYNSKEIVLFYINLTYLEHKEITINFKLYI